MSVFVAIPCRPGESVPINTAVAMMRYGTRANLYDFRLKSVSLLATCFNSLWCEALNERSEGVTHFAMMHDDVAPEPMWLDLLLSEQARVRADVLSVVIPLKDDRGLTSTGVMDWDTHKMKKLSLAEAHDLPVTFDAATAGYPGHCLLMNTGLWICDLTRPWAEKVVFRLHDTITRDPDGRFRSECVSEDWLFSVDCHRLGLRTYATRAVKVKHRGAFEYPNFVAWGSREDEGEWAHAWNIEPPSTWTQPRGDHDHEGALVRRTRVAG